MNLLTLDFEASSLSMYSFPVSVGWCDGKGESDYFLIAPQKDMTDWDYNSQALHGLSRNELTRDGISFFAAAKRLNSRLRNQRLFVTSFYDKLWANTLHEIAQVEQLYELRLVHEISTLSACAIDAIYKQCSTGNHNALCDARLLNQSIREFLVLEP